MEKSINEKISEFTNVNLLAVELAKQNLSITELANRVTTSEKGEYFEDELRNKAYKVLLIKMLKAD